LKLRISAALCAVIGSCLGLHGQTVSSSVVGTILDPASAAVSGAKVTLTDDATRSIRLATADASGTFRFVDLAPGTYSLSIQSTGFKALTETQIVVAAQETGEMLLGIRNRWPEWYPAWMAHGIVLYLDGHPEEARKALETALALGAPEAQAELDWIKTKPGRDAALPRLKEYFAGTVLHSGVR